MQSLLGNLRAAAPSPAGRLRVSIVNSPPSGIASRELIARLRIAISICVGSTSAGHRPGAEVGRTWIPAPIVRVSISRMPATTAFRSIARGCRC